MKLILILFGFLANQIAVILEAHSDVRKQKAGKAIKHAESAAWRGIAWTIFALAIHWKMGALGGLYALILGFQYWLTFDLLHNHLTGKDWYYGNSGPMDSFLGGKANRFYKLAFKIGLLLITGLIYFYFYANL